MGKKIFIIAGEASGDNIGASVISALKAQRKNLEFYGVGGQNMLEAGLSESYFPMEQISLMGFVEILPRIIELRRLLHDTAQYIADLKPDVLITIDSPGFTNRLTPLVKKLNPKQKAVHIVAPSVWAINPSRAEKLAQSYDMLLTLLPFEPKYFIPHGLESHFIGHPIFSKQFTSDRHQFCLQHEINEGHLLLAVTAGSRVGEIKRHLPSFIEAIEKMQLSIPQRIEVIFCLSNADHKKHFTSAVQKLGHIRAHFITENVIEAYGAADLALAKSGTNTLEIAASGTPQIIGYKMNIMTFALVKMMIKVKYACLVNIMSDKEIIPEFIQGACNSNSLSRALHDLALYPERGKQQVKIAQEVLRSFGFQSGKLPGARAAKLIKDRFL